MTQHATAPWLWRARDLARDIRSRRHNRILVTVRKNNTVVYLRIFPVPRLPRWSHTQGVGRWEITVDDIQHLTHRCQKVVTRT